MISDREEIENQHQITIQDRESEIDHLEKKMEDMSQEFAEMLKVRPRRIHSCLNAPCCAAFVTLTRNVSVQQTLERMSQKIEMESASMAASTTDAELNNKLSEFKLGFVDL